LTVAATAALGPFTEMLLVIVTLHSTVPPPPFPEPLH
jgi:hypothetical protein